MEQGHSPFKKYLIVPRSAERPPGCACFFFSRARCDWRERARKIAWRKKGPLSEQPGLIGLCAVRKQCGTGECARERRRATQLSVCRTRPRTRTRGSRADWSRIDGETRGLAWRDWLVVFERRRARLSTQAVVRVSFAIKQFRALRGLYNATGSSHGVLTGRRISTRPALDRGRGPREYMRTRSFEGSLYSCSCITAGANDRLLLDRLS